MNPTLKNVLKGAGVQLTIKSADALSYYALRHSGVPQATINKYPWFISIPGLGPLFPSLDDWVLDLGLPAIFYAAGKMSERRNPGRAASLKEMALGAALTGLGTWIHSLVDRLGTQELPGVGASPFNIDATWPGGTQMIRQAPIANTYAQGQESRFPWQRDMRW